MESNLLAVAWAQLWQVTLLVVVVAVLAQTLARKRPHLAYALWLVVLIKCVMPPIWSSPSGIFCWLQPSQGVSTSQLSVEVGAYDSRPLNAEYAATDCPAFAPSLVGAKEAESIWPKRLLVWGLMTWALGAALSLALSAWRWQRCLHAARRRGTEPSGELADLIQSLAQKLGLRRPIRVILTPGRLGPAVTGILHPVLLLPEGILHNKDSHEIEPILAHELIHIRRGDLWAGLLETIVLALWWFHPLVRWAVRQAMREAEKCCDEAVLAELGCKPKEYAWGLLDVLQYKTNWVPAPAFPGAGRVEGTATRLERIMRLGQGCRRRSPWWCWLVMLGAGAVVLPGGAFFVSGEAPNAPPPLATTADLPLQGVSAAPTHNKQPKLNVSLQEADPRAVLRTYALGDVIEEFRRTDGMETTRAREAIAWQVDAFLRRAAQQRGNMAWPVAWSEDRLLVRASLHDQESVAHSLEAIRVYGLAQLTVSVRFISGTPETINSLGIRWTVMPNEEGDEDNPLGLVPAWDPVTGIPNLDRPLPQSETAARRGSVRHIKHTPMRYAVLDEDAAASVIDQLQGDRHSNVMQAPKVTLFNGQLAAVSDVSQSPFVVSVKPVEGDQATALQPVISVVDEGTRLRLRPVLREDNEVWLDYEIIMTVIHEVNTFQFAAADAEKPVTLQLPVVETMQVEGASELPLGNTLVIAGLTKPKRKGQEPKPPESMLARLANGLLGGNAHSEDADSEKTSLMLLLRVEQVVPARPASPPDAEQVGMATR